MNVILTTHLQRVVRMMSEDPQSPTLARWINALTTRECEALEAHFADEKIDRAASDIGPGGVP